MGHGTISEDLDVILLCKEMKWSYTEMMNQPYWFIEGMNGVIREEIKKQNKDAKNTK